MNRPGEGLALTRPVGRDEQRVTLAAMPWQAIDSPSLPLGLLRTAAVAAGHPAPVVYPANLRWVELLMTRTGGGTGPGEYHDVAENGLFHSLGDWVFTGVLHDDPELGVEALTAYAVEHDLEIGPVRRMREHAAELVALAVDEILATGPTLVGFSTTFMQNVPSLAAARLLKQRAPHVRVVLGGGNCDGPMGAALHANYPFVDYVVSGEAEDAFPALLDALPDGDLAAVPGLIWRDGTGAQRCNPRGPAIPAHRLPAPDFGDYFERLADSPAHEHVEPRLALETARGCWWGEKHHCTFCGLNGTLMTFRAKSPDAVLDELTTLVTRHRVLDVIVVDNIIDNHYFGTVLPRIAALDWDLKLHYEVKANLKPADIAALHDAGVVQVQPGIESLVSDVLGLMDKGVSAVHNVRTLRDCEQAGLTVSWNWLYGFPGETTAGYRPVLEQLPALVHLQPPLGASRICLERFSPHFDNPTLGFAERTTAASYRHVYPWDEDRLRDMVYLFDTPPAGLSTEQARPLRDQVDRWLVDYYDSTLRLSDEGDVLTLIDRRVGWPEKDHRIAGPTWRAAYLELMTGHSVAGLRRRLADQEITPTTEELTDWLTELRGHGLVFEESGRFVALAVTADPIKMPPA
ncbi:RiPP maturation radical SAM C-methyltransferase [Micromonosporaceae bacterium Da 78-11]